MARLIHPNGPSRVGKADIGHPDLGALPIAHCDTYPPGPGGRIFTGPRSGMFTDRAYLRVFHKARAEAFTGTEAASLLARRPYGPAQRGGIDLAERRNSRSTGSRLGRAQPRRADAGLRQVRHRPAERGQAPDPRSDPAARPGDEPKSHV